MTRTQRVLNDMKAFLLGVSGATVYASLKENLPEKILQSKTTIQPIVGKISVNLFGYTKELLSQGYSIIVSSEPITLNLGYLFLAGIGTLTAYEISKHYITSLKNINKVPA